MTLITAASTLLLLLMLHFIFPLRDEPRCSTVITDNNGEILHAFLSPDDKWRMAIQPGDVSPVLKRTILYKEDKYFYYHPGINPIAIFRAGINNLLKNKKTSGASTITMQVARLLYPKQRTYINKIIEMFRALQLEIVYTKEEILNLYLELVPYGGNIEGIRSASYFYFNTSPSKLNLSQTVLLSIIPNKPGSLNPAKGTSTLKNERDKWLKRLAADGICSKNESNEAMKEEVYMKRRKAPSSSPHLARMLKQKYPERELIVASINRKIQEKAESISYSHYRRLSLKNIYNLSVVIVDNKTRSICGYVGSPDFTDALHAGEVDGCIAVRSPGSTLKPLVYAMAIDKGMITANTLLEDVPVNFNGYAPENFNSKFNGQVTASKALAYSLNIPAVELLESVGMKDFTSMLRKSGFKAIKKDNEMGLSLILGGCGVRPVEMAALYSSLANNGMYAPLKFTVDASEIPPLRIVSNAASYMVTDMLTGLVRPDLPNNVESSLHVPAIAWKTGTSYGRRDAWSIGYNANYSVVVWAGNFNGQGVPELTGADIATPLLFDIFHSIEKQTQRQWFEVPSEIDYRMVCSHSGSPPGEHCTDFITDAYIPGVSSISKCDHVKLQMTDPDETYSYCMQCAPETGFKKSLYDNLTPSVYAFYTSNNIYFRKVPPHNPVCTRLFTGNRPRITSPVDNMEYLLEKNAGQQLQLACNAEPGISSVFWYINNEFIKKATPGEVIFFTPGPGANKISCSDDKGRNTDINIEVQYF